MSLSADDSRAFLDAGPDAIVIVDEFGLITFANAEAEALFRYRREELVGRSIGILLPGRYRERHAEHVLSYLVAPARRSMSARSVELVGRRSDGKEFPAEISLNPVVTASGTFVSSAIRDVTARKDAEREFVEARKAAEEASRAKSAFLAAASHDLRQPLQTLTLLSAVINRSVPAESRAAVAVASQSEALRMMGELLNALLDIGKLEAGVIKPDITDCSVARIFTRLRSEFAVVAEAKGLDLIVDECRDVVRSDPTLLGQIVQNLLANAIRYTREGWVRLRCLASTDTVRIEVLDTGVGIPVEELDVIFDDYYQSSRSSHERREGVGLGLSITRRITDLLGCSLEVTSTPGQGSCFSLHVPRSEAREAADRPESGTPASPGEHDALIVVIDDDEPVANATAMLLASSGFDVIVAASAEQALGTIEGAARPPGLFFCDYHLGGDQTGLDVVRIVRDATGLGLPTILVSGDTSSRVAREVKHVADCHLRSKPVNADELLQLCEQLLMESPEPHANTPSRSPRNRASDVDP